MGSDFSLLADKPESTVLDAVSRRWRRPLLFQASDNRSPRLTYFWETDPGVETVALRWRMESLGNSCRNVLLRLGHALAMHLPPCSRANQTYMVEVMLGVLYAESSL